MKIIYLSIFFLICGFNLGCSSTSSLWNNNSRSLASIQEVHLIFDIDWTLVSPLSSTEHLISPKEKNVIEVNGVKYKIHNGVSSLFKLLSLIDGVKISFFSGGETQRNVDLLKSIKVDNNKTLYDIAHKIMGKENLTLVNADKSLGFSERFKKDIRLISDDLENAFLIDDDDRFSLNNTQKKSMISLEGAFYYFPFYQNAFDAKNSSILLQDYVPKSAPQWLVGRNKLVLLRELIQTEVSGENSLSSLKEALKQIQHKNKFSRSYTFTNLYTLLRPNTLGANERMLYEQAQFIDFNSRNECVDSLSDIIL